MVLVDPIKLTPSGAALPEDRELYGRSLADGMESILKKKIDPEDRFRIADEMKALNWSRLVESLAGIYDRLMKNSPNIIVFRITL